MARMRSGALALALVVLWAATTLVIYMLPWSRYLRNPDDAPNATGEVTLFLAALIAVIVVFACTFVVSLLVVPVRMDNALRSTLAEVENSINDAVNAESVLQELSDLYREGRKIYGEYDDPLTWEAKMQKWEDRVEHILRAEFSVSDLHKFRRPGSNFGFHTEWCWEPYSATQDIELKGKFANRLVALDEIVMSSTRHIGSKSKLADLSSAIRRRVL